MSLKRAAMLLLMAFAVIWEVGAYREKYVIPAEDDLSCPLGDEIPCGTVIDKNGTLLRYERGNMTEITSSVPGENCPWMIKGPTGTQVLLQTTCFHHFYNNASKEEHNVCFHVWKGVGSIASSRSCGHGFYQKYLSSHHEENFTVYYQSGVPYALGFSVLITFTGEPDQTPGSGVTTMANISVVLLGFLVQWVVRNI